MSITYQIYKFIGNRRFLVRSKEFADGVNELAKILNVLPHSDPLVTLTAVRKVITKRMAPDRVENPDNYILTVSLFVML